MCIRDSSGGGRCAKLGASGRSGSDSANTRRSTWPGSALQYDQTTSNGQNTSAIAEGRFDR